MTDSLERPPKHRFAVTDVERMFEAGILAPDARVELLDGDVVEMVPIGDPHAAIVDRMARALFARCGDRFVLRVQGPIQLSDITLVQPDLTVLRPRANFYADRKPGPRDVVLAIEVSDTTLRQDLLTKIPLYARHGVPRAWLVDVTHRRIHTFSAPTAQGYRRQQLIEHDDHIALPADLGEIPVHELLG